MPDRSGPQKMLDLCDNKLHIYFKPRYVSIDVATNTPEARVTFYLINRTDQTNEPFTAEIKVYDSSGYLLCENIIEDYKGGVYITYKLSGRIQFHILRRTNTDAPCGEVYGLFF